jgi:hypothetical protein
MANIKFMNSKIFEWLSSRVQSELPQYWKERVNVVSMGSGNARNDAIFSRHLSDAQCKIIQYNLIDIQNFQPSYDSHIKSQKVSRIIKHMEEVKLISAPVITLYSQSLHCVNPNKVLKETTFGPHGSVFTLILENSQHPICSYLDDLKAMCMKQGLKVEKQLMEETISVDKIDEEQIRTLVGATDQAADLSVFIQELIDKYRVAKAEKSPDKRFLKISELYGLIISRRTRDQYDPIFLWENANNTQ